MTVPSPMVITSANIIVGACTSFTVDSNAIGGTSGGVTFEKKQTFTDLSVDQATATVKKAVKQEVYTVTTTMSESTLANLQIALGSSQAPVVATTPASTTLNLSMEKTAIEHILVFVGPCPAGTSNYTTRTFTVNRAVNVSALKLDIAKDKEQLFQVAFDCLPDLSKTASQGQFGTIVDQ